jgi:hypothetical protein
MLSFRFVHFPWPRRWQIQFGTRPQDGSGDYPIGTMWHDWLLIGWRLCHSAHLKTSDNQVAMRCWLVDETGPVEWVDGVTGEWAAIKANWRVA